MLAAEPGSKIYAGLKPGVDRAALEREIARGNVRRSVSTQFEPRSAIACSSKPARSTRSAPGCLIAEIQQASDTTYRLFDWNRVDRDGKPRPLHVEQALDMIDFSRGPVNPVTADSRPIGRTSNGWSPATSSCSIAGSIDAPQQLAARRSISHSGGRRGQRFVDRRRRRVSACAAATRFSFRRPRATSKSRRRAGRWSWTCICPRFPASTSLGQYSRSSPIIRRPI